MKSNEYVKKCEDVFNSINENDYSRVHELLVLEHHVFCVLLFNRDILNDVYDDAKSGIVINEHVKPVMLYYKRAVELIETYRFNWEKDIKVKLYLSYLKCLAFQNISKKIGYKPEIMEFKKFIKKSDFDNTDITDLVSKLDFGSFKIEPYLLESYYPNPEKDREEREAMHELAELLKENVANNEEYREISYSEPSINEQNELNWESFIRGIQESLIPHNSFRSIIHLIKSYTTEIGTFVFFGEGEEPQRKVEETLEFIENIYIEGVEIEKNILNVDEDSLYVTVKIKHQHLEDYQYPLNFEILDDIKI